MSDKDLLWVEVGAKTVRLHDGAKMPTPTNDYLSFMWHFTSMSRAEFTRWSGLSFPKGFGVYAVRVKLAQIKRYRVVRSEEFVAAKHRTAKLEEVK
jgi:hypothetical protein